MTPEAGSFVFRLRGPIRLVGLMGFRDYRVKSFSML